MTPNKITSANQLFLYVSVNIFTFNELWNILFCHKTRRVCNVRRQNSCDTFYTMPSSMSNGLQNTSMGTYLILEDKYNVKKLFSSCTRVHVQLPSPHPYVLCIKLRHFWLPRLSFAYCKPFQMQYLCNCATKLYLR